MKNFLLFLSIFCLILSACSRQANKQQSSEKIMQKVPLITIGDNLEAYVGRKVQIIGTVSNTKYPGLGNYWITSQALEDYRDKKIHVWGTVIKQNESSQKGFVQGRDGVYYHLKVEKVIELK